MKKLIAYFIPLILFLTFAQLLSAQEPSTIFVTDTGWSNPTVGSWDPATRTATLTSDINQTIQIDADNIILDGNGYTITGDGTGEGVYLSGRIGVTIKNLKIQNFADGFYLYLSHNNILMVNNVSNNYTGMLVMESSNNALINNTVSGNSSGIILYESSDNVLSHNTISNNHWAGLEIDPWLTFSSALCN